MKSEIPEQMTVTAAAKHFGISKPTVYKAINAGVLKTTTNKQGITVLLKSDVEARRAHDGMHDKKAQRPKPEAISSNVQPLSAENAPKTMPAPAVPAQPLPQDAAETMAAATMVTRDVLLKDISLEDDIQVRAGFNVEAVEEYVQRMAEGEQFPPIHLFEENGKFYIGDGWHRVMAVITRKYQRFPAVVQRGGRTAALRFALSANSKHGLPRTNQDKIRALQLAFATFSGPVFVQSVISALSVSPLYVFTAPGAFRAHLVKSARAATARSIPRRLPGRPQSTRKFAAGWLKEELNESAWRFGGWKLPSYVTCEKSSRYFYENWSRNLLWKQRCRLRPQKRMSHHHRRRNASRQHNALVCVQA